MRARATISQKNTFTSDRGKMWIASRDGAATRDIAGKTTSEGSGERTAQLDLHEFPDRNVACSSGIHDRSAIWMEHLPRHVGRFVGGEEYETQQQSSTVLETRALITRVSLQTSLSAVSVPVKHTRPSALPIRALPPVVLVSANIRYDIHADVHLSGPAFQRLAIEVQPRDAPFSARKVQRDVLSTA
jgi:hypothetical protein